MAGSSSSDSCLLKIPQSTHKCPYFLGMDPAQASTILRGVTSQPEHSTACSHTTGRLFPSLSPGLPSLLSHIYHPHRPSHLLSMSSDDFGTLDPSPSLSGLGAPAHHWQEPALSLASPHRPEPLTQEHQGPHGITMCLCLSASRFPKCG